MKSSESEHGLDQIPESGGTSDHQVAQLLRLPGRSGLAVSPSSSSGGYVREIDSRSLTMYTNQVGGHQVLVKPKDSSIILKPYDEAEYNFYDQCVPLICSALMPFTARCFGEIDLRTTSSDYMSPSGSTPVIPGKGGKYVMLEDLAHGISRPCILDLKMGLKQRSIRNYSEKKVLSKESKSKSTTSHILGFRLGGAQLYKVDGIVFHNKYFGRLQDVEGTYEILRSFFKSVANIAIRQKIIKTLIAKLVELREVIKSLWGFRFWSGSLLLIFDSAIGEDTDVDKSVILKMIDFANYTRLERNRDYDREYVYGIDSLVLFLQGVFNDAIPSSILKRMAPAPSPTIQDEELIDAVESYREATFSPRIE